MTKFAPTVPSGPFEHYKARLEEIGRLAARLDSDPRRPLEVILDFFEVDEHDLPIVIAHVVIGAYDKPLPEEEAIERGFT